MCSTRHSRLGEYVKEREYKDLQKWKCTILHRVPGTRSAVFDRTFARDIRTVVYMAGCGFMKTQVQILGTVGAVHEEYVAASGRHVADKIDFNGEYAVFLVTDVNEKVCTV